MPVSPLGPQDPETVGPFLLLGRVAAGGMGVAYLGRRHGRADSLVVVKTLRPDVALPTGLVDRLRSEARVGRELTDLLGDGCAMARFVAAEPDSERPWIATEYVPGPSLLEVARGRGLPPAAVGSLAVQIAGAIAELHRLGYAHRDVKPANIVVGPDGARLVDLGLTRHVSAVRDPVAMGSPGWSPPEQNEDAPDARPGDVHGWGMSVAYAAAGRSPFGSGSGQLVTRRMRTGRPRLHGVPPALHPLLSAALRPEPRERPAAEDVVAGLEALPPLLGAAASSGSSHAAGTVAASGADRTAVPSPTEALGAPTLLERAQPAVPASGGPLRVPARTRGSTRLALARAGGRRRVLLAGASAAAAVLLWAALPHGPGGAEAPAVARPTLSSTTAARPTATPTTARRPVASPSPLAQRSAPAPAATHGAKGKGHGRKH